MSRENVKLQQSKSIDGCLKYLFWEKNRGEKNNMSIFMFVCNTVLYEYMNSMRNDVCNLFFNTHVLIKIYGNFYHCIIYIANEGRHVKINNIYTYIWTPFLIALGLLFLLYISDQQQKT
jgi:hypothetical protein